jgi:outer membrane protein TolC
LEIARQYPDVHLAPGYQFDQGEHKLSLGLSVELPILNQNQGPIAEAKARRERAAAQLLALQAKIIAQIDLALAVRNAALDQLARQESLTRLARQQFSAVESQFNAGAADKLDLAGARVDATASDLALLDAQTKVRQALAQLEDAIQRPLEAMPVIEQGRASHVTQKQP